MLRQHSVCRPRRKTCLSARWMYSRWLWNCHQTHRQTTNSRSICRSMTHKPTCIYAPLKLPMQALTIHVLGWEYFPSTAIGWTSVVLLMTMPRGIWEKSLTQAYSQLRLILCVIQLLFPLSLSCPWAHQLTRLAQPPLSRLVLSTSPTNCGLLDSLSSSTLLTSLLRYVIYPWFVLTFTARFNYLCCISIWSFVEAS